MATDVSGSIAAGDEPDHELVLAAVLERIPVKWGRYIYCGRGWFGIVARLDAAIAELVPD